ncbi:MAG: hypothetical protein NTY38_31810 [Acidobacteria bacterium]|nr:hypothetical protein [Acidobacteriota bacterium]
MLGIGAAGGGHALDNGVHLFLREVAVLLPGGKGLFYLDPHFLNCDEVLILKHGAR